MISRAALRQRLPLPVTTSLPNPLKTLITRFSSSWSSTDTAATTPHEHSTGVETAPYIDPRKFARPATVTWSERLHNSVSFIGTLEYPLRQFATNNGKFGVHTILRVQSSPNSPYTFRILLAIWDTLAKTALAHLKPNDHIYVAGHLGSFMKSTVGGTERLHYKVTANELNYVQVPEQNSHVAKPKLETGESSEEKHRKKLLLWQLFFANPDEWYDCRGTKKSPRHPDFRHKSTREALWMNRDDPSWVKKQLEKLESRCTGKANDDQPFGSSLSNWVFDEELTVPGLTESKDDHSYSEGVL